MNLSTARGAEGTASMDANDELDRRLVGLSPEAREALSAAQSALSSAIASAGLNFEGRPYPVSIRPLTINASQATELAELGEKFVALLDTAANLYVKNSRARRLFPAYDVVADLICALPSIRPLVTICRLDGLFAPDGRFRILETNTEGPGGVIQNGMVGQIWAKIDNPLVVDLDLDVATQPFIRDSDCFLHALIEAHVRRTGRSPRSAAIVNFKGRFTNEVAWMVSGLNRLGVKAAVSDAADLRRSDQGLVDIHGTPIDLVYNKLDVRDLINEPKVQDYLSAIAAGEVTSINCLVSQWVLSDKAILALLSDPEFSDHFSDAERALIDAHVPWTRYVRSGFSTDLTGRSVDLLQYIRSHQKNLVLKPSNATRGEGVAIGRFLSPSQWADCLDSAAGSMPYVVQEYISPSSVQAPDPMTGEVLHLLGGLDLYVFGGRFAGFQARASLDPVMNVGRRGVLLPTAILKA